MLISLVVEQEDVLSGENYKRFDLIIFCPRNLIKYI